jgi:hypothetical protein
MSSFLFVAACPPELEDVIGVSTAQAQTGSPAPRAAPPAQVKQPEASLHKYKDVPFFVPRQMLSWLRGNLNGRPPQDPWASVHVGDLMPWRPSWTHGGTSRIPCMAAILAGTYTKVQCLSHVQTCPATSSLYLRHSARRRRDR